MLPADPSFLTDPNRPLQDRTAILDPLRGIAALGVVLFHFGAAILPTIANNPLAGSLVLGKLGVQVFFAISGFVIPLALHRMQYTYRDIGTFMAKRYVRIAPPAYISALIMVVFHFISLWYKGTPIAGSGIYSIDAPTILTNLTFTAMYFDTPWLNFAYWTLTVEFEFYILIALAFPLFRIHRQVAAIGFVLLLIGMRSFSLPMLCEHAIFFVPGILVYFRKERMLNNMTLLLLTGCCALVGYLHDDTLQIVVALATGLLIMRAPNAQVRLLTWLGTISYSLYITHIPVGFVAESGIKRITDLHHSVPGKLVLLVVYMGISLLAAWVFHRLVELPFHRLSKTIGTKK